MGGIKISVGEKYGKLTVVECVKEGKKVRWKCRCDCGNYVTAIANRLASGHVKSCGCLQHTHEDLTGKRFGKLTVIREVERPESYKKRSDIFWECKCDCGNVITVISFTLLLSVSNKSFHLSSL